jgi:hypothetical protein
MVIRLATSATALFSLLAVLIGGTTAFAQSGLRYPVVFDKAADMKRLGLVLSGITDDSDDVEEFPNGCYYYGDGGYPISFSRDFLARFRARGFSRRSLCLGLVSEIKFNPETGTRLPTYIVIRASDYRNRRADDTSLSGELPLDFPNCFARALPYTDCTWNYDAYTGRRLSQTRTQAFQSFGQRIERFLSTKQNKEECRSPVSDSVFMNKCSFQPEDVQRPPQLLNGMPTLYDYDTVFPKGYGYALDADGAAGPDREAATRRYAVDANRKATSATIELLRRQQR